MATSCARLAESNVFVYWAMRYQNPSIASVLERMAHDGVTDITVLPLYPQYSLTTTETALDAIANALYDMHKARKLRNDQSLFNISTIHDYHVHPAYIAALAQSIQTHWQTHGRPDFAAGDKLLLSFHGLPERNIKRGDPYQSQCEATYQALLQGLGLSSEQVLIAYQSRFGKQKWIEPYTQATLEQLAKTGTKYAYSGEGLKLLQLVEEEITNKTVEDLAIEQVFKPIGMTRTGYTWHKEFDDNYAIGHLEDGNLNPKKKRTTPVASGSLVTTISDYSKFIEFRIPTETGRQ